MNKLFGWRPSEKSELEETSNLPARYRCPLQRIQEEEGSRVWLKPTNKGELNANVNGRRDPENLKAQLWKTAKISFHELSISHHSIKYGSYTKSDRPLGTRRRFSAHVGIHRPHTGEKDLKLRPVLCRLGRTFTHASSIPLGIFLFGDYFSPRRIPSAGTFPS